MKVGDTTYIITGEQLTKIRRALYLADYFVQDTKGGTQVEQWESDKDTYEDAIKAYEEIAKFEVIL